jgi:hypothetical protein
MSPFWRNYESNGKSRYQPVNELREALADACEDFVRDKLPLGVKRNALLKELNQLVTHYRDSANWPGK